jgi:hypothetical protein
MLPNAHTAEPNNTAPARSDIDREITAVADKSYSSSATRAYLRPIKTTIPQPAGQVASRLPTCGYPVSGVHCRQGVAGLLLHGE